MPEVILTEYGVFIIQRSPSYYSGIIGSSLPPLQSITSFTTGRTQDTVVGTTAAPLQPHPQDDSTPEATVGPRGLHRHIQGVMSCSRTGNEANYKLFSWLQSLMLRTAYSTVT